MLAYPTASVVAGLAAGWFACLLDVRGPAPLDVVGAGLAMWLTLSFIVARLGRTAAWGCVGACLFLAAWLVGFYLTKSALIGMEARYLWPAARPWTAILLPASLGVGVTANLSTRPGRLGDMTLATPLVWTLVECGLVLTRCSFAVTVAVTAIELLAALIPLGLERGRSVNLRWLLTGAVAGTVPYAVLVGLILGRNAPP